MKISKTLRGFFIHQFQQSTRGYHTAEGESMVQKIQNSLFDDLFDHRQSDNELQINTIKYYLIYMCIMGINAMECLHYLV